MSRFVLLLGAAAIAIVGATHASEARSAAFRAWPPFVLVVGLLLIGQVAQRDGLFEHAARAVGRIRGRGAVFFVALLGLVAVTTAVLNLDTAVAFLTPVAVLAARRRGLRASPFVYGTLFMANAASLLLPGSNLTNLLVLAGDKVPGAVFAARMAPAWIAAVITTMVVSAVWFRRDFSAEVDRTDGDAAGVTLGSVGLVASGAAAALVIGARSPAIAVLSVGIAAVLVEAGRSRMLLGETLAALDLPVVAGLYGIAVALGTLAALWTGPTQLLQHANAAETAAIAALASVAVNNLPAAVMLSARAPQHPRALLIGLNIGPNLAVTGSLSALLWFKAAKSVGVRPSLLRVSRIGLVLVPCTIATALAALALFAPGRT